MPGLHGMKSGNNSTQGWDCKKKKEKEIGEELGPWARGKGKSQAAWYVMSENAERATKNKVELIANIFLSIT